MIDGQEWVVFGHQKMAVIVAPKPDYIGWMNMTWHDMMMMMMTMTVIYNIPTSMEIPFLHAKSTVKYHGTLCECNSDQTQTINSLGILKGIK